MSRHYIDASIVITLLLLLLVAPGCLPAGDGDGEPACQDDTDCAEQEVCLRPPADRSQCVADCTGDSSICSETESCTSRYEPNPQEEDRGELVCFPATVRCEARSDCPAGMVCDEMTGRCAQPDVSDECDFDTDCGPGEICMQPSQDANRCVADCSDDATVCEDAVNCVPRYALAGATSMCLPDDVLCSSNEGCPGSVRCADSGFCEADAQPVECDSDVNCPIGEICFEGECVEG